MLLAFDAICEGNWASEPPEEWVDAELMAAYGWTFADLQATPVYVRQFCWDRVALIHAANAKAAEDAERSARG